MKIQIVGLGNVGTSLIKLLIDRKNRLKDAGREVLVVSVSDSSGTAVNMKGLDLLSVLRYKQLGWKGFGEYVKGYGALSAIREIESDAVVELTPSTRDGQPGLSHIRTALLNRRNVVTANKGSLVTSFAELTKLAEANKVRLFYEATVAGHLPVFCLTNSCFKADDLLGIQGILNATTNFILCEMERGKNFGHALEFAIKAGWAETDCLDDVDGIDAARKVVILANSLFKQSVSMRDVKVTGIRHVDGLLKRAGKSGKRVKLICEISGKKRGLDMTVGPRMISSRDPLATVNDGDMGMKFMYKTCQQVFVSVKFSGPLQTAYAVLNDILKTGK